VIETVGGIYEERSGSTVHRPLSALQRIRPILSPGMLYLLLNLVVSKSEES